MIKKYKSLIYVIFILFVFTPFVSKADTVGDNIIFNVEPGYDYNGRSQITAQNLKVGEHCYLYVDNEYFNALTSVEKDTLQIRLNNLSEEFDNNIYPKLRIVYGSEWTPGIDNDEKITLLFYKLIPDAGGYFTAIDENLKNNVPNSNQREMIYLNTRVIGSERIKSFIAHEFQHLITYFQKYKLKGLIDDSWLEEGRSEYTPTILGYDSIYNGSNLEERVESFISQPYDSLTEWENSFYDYGSTTLFMQYLIDQYGINIIPAIINSNSIGIESINNGLNLLGINDSFSDIFTNWSITNFLNDKSTGEKYSYKNTSLGYAHMHIYPSASFSIYPYTNITTSAYVKDWSPRWYKFNYQPGTELPTDTLAIEFFGNTKTSNFKVPYILYYTDGTKEVKNIQIDKNTQQGKALISRFGTNINSVVVIPSNQFKTSGFTTNDPDNPFTIKASMVTAPSYEDGSLIRAFNDTKVYILKGDFKRWIQYGEIFNFYGHLGWDKIQNVPPDALDFYKNAWLVRVSDDFKVYEINGDGTKHWLNISAEQFTASGRNWDMIYEINNRERDFYVTGADVMQ